MASVEARTDGGDAGAGLEGGSAVVHPPLWGGAEGHLQHVGIQGAGLASGLVVGCCEAVPDARRGREVAGPDRHRWAGGVVPGLDDRGDGHADAGGDVSKEKERFPTRWDWSSRIRLNGTFTGRVVRLDNPDKGRVIECSHEHQYRWQAGECAVRQAAYLNEKEGKDEEGHGHPVLRRGS